MNRTKKVSGKLAREIGEKLKAEPFSIDWFDAATIGTCMAFVSEETRRRIKIDEQPVDKIIAKCFKS